MLCIKREMNCKKNEANKRIDRISGGVASTHEGMVFHIRI